MLIGLGNEENAMSKKHESAPVIDLKPHLDAKRAEREAEIRRVLPGFRSAPDRAMPVVPGFEKAYDITYWILKANPNLTPEKLADYLEEF